jgi:hypothetical protein
VNGYVLTHGTVRYVCDSNISASQIQKYKLDLMLFHDKIKFRIDQATKLLSMKALYNIYNVPGVLL